MKIPLTGTTGFAGQALIEHLLFNSCEARVLLRDSSAVVQLSKFYERLRLMNILNYLIFSLVIGVLLNRDLLQSNFISKTEVARMLNIWPSTVTR